MSTPQLCRAWSLLSEYEDFRRLAKHRQKLDEQLQRARIPLTHVPWKSMVRAVLTRRDFDDEQLKEMSKHDELCCNADDVLRSQSMVKVILENEEDDGTWFEINELKQRFRRAQDVLPRSRHDRREMLRRLLGYPVEETVADDDLSTAEEEPLDLDCVLTLDDQRRMRTGDVIELSGNRLHDAFYLYRLPRRGIWVQIKEMWNKHQISKFRFDDAEAAPDEEIILIPAMDEYGYGVPYLFATWPVDSLPDGAHRKYVDINCPLVSLQTLNPTVALVQQYLNERLHNSVDHDGFPHQFVAIVSINEAPVDQVLWKQRRHFNGKDVATDLNDDFAIFFSRRILEASSS